VREEFTFSSCWRLPRGLARDEEVLYDASCPRFRLYDEYAAHVPIVGKARSRRAQDMSGLARPIV